VVGTQSGTKEGARSTNGSELVASEVDVVAGLKSRRCGRMFPMIKVLKEAIAEV
jgi:hypothetical protein